MRETVDWEGQEAGLSPITENQPRMLVSSGGTTFPADSRAPGSLRGHWPGIQEPDIIRAGQ